MAKDKSVVNDAADSKPMTLELLWADQWMETLPFVPGLMELRTAFVRQQLRDAHVRRTAGEWARRWQTFQTLVP